MPNKYITPEQIEEDLLENCIDMAVTGIMGRPPEPELATGIPSLDAIIWGLKRKELVILAGRTGNFKTALMLQMAWNLVDANKEVALFSMEMGREAVIERLISNRAGVTSEALERHTFTPEQAERITFATNEIKELKLKLYIHDRTGFHYQDIIDYCKIKSPDVIFIDYVQMINSEGNSERFGYGEYCRQMKVLSKEKNCSIVLGSQANRAAVEKQDDPECPRLENLKGSGVLEENPDVVLICHSRYKYKSLPEYYNDLEIMVAKKRNGRTGSAHAILTPEYYRIK